MKTLYLVMVCEHPSVSIGTQSFKPTLPQWVKGYAPIYTNKRAARKDWPRREQKILVEIKPSKQ